jgi:hypothetical protein
LQERRQHRVQERRQTHLEHAGGTQECAVPC